MTDTILILNGPNLGLLGSRQPEIYGSATLDDHIARAEATALEAGLAVEHLQTESESEMIGAIHGARDRAAGIVINAAAFTHYSWAIADALGTFDGPVVEVHISNPHAREAWRHTSVITPAATALVTGVGGYGYTLAVKALAHLLGDAR